MFQCEIEERIVVTSRDPECKDVRLLIPIQVVTDEVTGEQVK